LFECDASSVVYFTQSLSLNQIDILGADIPGTLFGDDKACGWNVNTLDTPLKEVAKLPGISSAMLYFGSWRAMFAFHTEDLDLYSINYIHTGTYSNTFLPIFECHNYIFYVDNRSC
jgi:hypothetical protein